VPRSGGCRNPIDGVGSSSGDGDLGVNLARGAKAIEEILPLYQIYGSAEALKATGMTFQSVVGGSSGPFYAVFLLRAAASLRAANTSDPKAWAKASLEACDAIGKLGDARAGDRTMLDCPAAIRKRICRFPGRRLLHWGCPGACSACGGRGSRSYGKYASQARAFQLFGRSRDRPPRSGRNGRRNLAPSHSLRDRLEFMKRSTASISILLTLTGTLLSASDTATILSIRAPTQSTLTADPDSSFWKHAPGVFANQDTMGNPAMKEVMEIRSRWTQDNLYLLFICAFDLLYLKPDPDPAQETNRLWNWDVAEAFIGNDFNNINRYKEFEVSPQGEWVDLDIDRNKSGGSPDAWRWNSGFKVKARIDNARKVWYAEMSIPSSRFPGIPLRLDCNFKSTSLERRETAQLVCC